MSKYKNRYRLDETDHLILDILLENTRVAFTDIAKKLNIFSLNKQQLTRSKCSFFKQHT